MLNTSDQWKLTGCVSGTFRKIARRVIDQMFPVIEAKYFFVLSDFEGFDIKNYCRFPMLCTQSTMPTLFDSLVDDRTNVAYYL